MTENMKAEQTRTNEWTGNTDFLVTRYWNYVLNSNANRSTYNRRTAIVSMWLHIWETFAFQQRKLFRHDYLSFRRLRYSCRGLLHSSEIRLHSFGSRLQCFSVSRQRQQESVASIQCQQHKLSSWKSAAYMQKSAAMFQCQRLTLTTERCIATASAPYIILAVAGCMLAEFGCLLSAVGCILAVSAVCFVTNVAWTI